MELEPWKRVWHVQFIDIDNIQLSVLSWLALFRLLFMRECEKLHHSLISFGSPFNFEVQGTSSPP